MKKYLIIGGIIVLAIGVLGFIIPPPDGFWGGSEIASDSELEETILPEPAPPRYSWDVLPKTQIEDEEIVLDEQFTPTGLLYAELLYPKVPKFLINKVSGDYVSDLGKAVSVETKFGDTKLEWINVGTLYVRAKKDGNLTDRTLTAKIISGTGIELISITFTREELEMGWITKWESAVGKWTPGQLKNANLVVSTTGTGEPILISSVKLYVEQQRSLVENFDSYNDGDLNGQGGWTRPAGTSLTVQGTIVKAGTKAVMGVYSDGTPEMGLKTFTAQADGNQVVWLRYTAGNTRGYVWIGNSSNTTIIWFEINYTAGTGANTIAYYNGSTRIKIADTAINTWYRCEIQWQASDDKARYRIGTSDASPGTWTNWDTCYGTWNTFDRVTLVGGYDAAGTIYFDELSDPNAAPPPTIVEDPPVILIID